MAKVVEFGQDLGNRSEKKKKKGVILYPPKNGKTITVRFIGKQEKIYQTWDSVNRLFLCSEKKKEGSILRILSFVIDRADEKVKVFICPSSVFYKIERYIKELNSSYMTDYDFRIQRTGEGFGTRYEFCLSGKKTSVSDELLDRIKATSQAYSLLDIVIKKAEWELLDSKYDLSDYGPVNNRFDILDL